MKPHVILRGVHYSTRHYFDYLATGFELLAQAGEIEFECRPLMVSRVLRGRAVPAMLRRVAPALDRRLSRGNYTCVTGDVRFADRAVRFAFDIGDSPYEFRLDILRSVDLYFKCQHPPAIEAAGFPLARDVSMPFDPAVLAMRDKVRPAMLGRPLSRTLDLRRNLKVLAEWEQLAHTPKSVSLLAFFGTDRVPNSSIEAPILERCGGTASHPNIKRGELVTWLQSNFPTSIDARVLFGDRPDRRGAALNDHEYPRLVARSGFNLNISGRRRSIPFRFIDSFMVGTGIVTDNLAVRWYQPFEEGTETIEIGNLGYERPENAEWDRAHAMLEELMSTAMSRSAAIRPAILERYRKYWHPRPLARYVLGQCESVA